MSPFAKGSIIGASLGFAITVLAFLPAATSSDRHNMGAAMMALTVSAPALLLSRLIGISLSTEGLAPLVFVAPITNMLLLAALFGLIGYLTRFFRRTR
jgi:hypothetical protein